MEKYDDDLKKFGFDSYDIDFSDVSLEDTKALCEFIHYRIVLKEALRGN